MSTYALLSCTKDKKQHSCPASEMYTESTLFRKAWAHAVGQGQSPMILSAKYGLLLPDRVIDTYDETLIGKRKGERYNWAMRVWPHLWEMLQPGDTVVSYMGKVYEEFIVTWLQEHEIHVKRPLQGLGVGQRLAWFIQQARSEA